MSRITKIKIAYGLSFEEGGIWHKPEVGIEMELNSKDDYKLVYKQAKDIVNGELRTYLDDSEDSEV